jgi:hypothetical protein
VPRLRCQCMLLLPQGSMILDLGSVQFLWNGSQLSPAVRSVTIRMPGLDYNDFGEGSLCRPIWARD